MIPRSVEQAGGEAVLAVVDAGLDEDRDRHEREPQSERDQQRGAQEVGDVLAVARYLLSAAITTVKGGYAPLQGKAGMNEAPT